MIIEDDGIGFDPAAIPPRQAFGLTAMRERVEVLDGRIDLRSSLARYTLQRWICPFRASGGSGRRIPEFALSGAKPGGAPEKIDAGFRFPGAANK
jgi:hypothetical protein